MPSLIFKKKNKPKAMLSKKKKLKMKKKYQPKNVNNMV